MHPVIRYTVAHLKNGNYQKVAETSSATYLDKKRSAGKTYYYKVRAIKKQKSGTGYGSFSGIKSCRALKKSGITSVRSASSTKLEIQWNAVNGANRYELYRSTKKNGSYKKNQKYIGNQLYRYQSYRGKNLLLQSARLSVIRYSKRQKFSKQCEVRKNLKEGSGCNGSHRRR